MGERSSQIERQIDVERGELGENLHELQAKIQKATDWREQFQKRPMVMVGAALGGGLLLASLTSGRRRHRHYPASPETSERSEHRRGTELQKNAALETFDSIKGAMVGVAANSFKDLLSELVPGFKTQFEKTVNQKRNLSTASEPVH